MAKWEIWRAGYMTTGMSAPEKAALVASVEAETFDAAVCRHIESLPESERTLYQARSDGWTYWGCGLYPTQERAAADFG